MNLDDYAQHHAVTKSRRRRRCLTCGLDEATLKQINDSRHKTPPVPFPTISRWLEDEHGIKLQPNTIRNHFVAGHDND